MMRRLVLAPLATIACLAAHDPGTSLGTFAVDGALKTQTCGAAMQSQILDPWTFDVRLSRSGPTLFWLQDASPPLSGLVDPSGTVRAARVAHATEPSSVAPPIAHATPKRRSPIASVDANVRRSHAEGFTP